MSFIWLSLWQDWLNCTSSQWQWCRQLSIDLLQEVRLNIWRYQIEVRETTEKLLGLWNNTNTCPSCTPLQKCSESKSFPNHSTTGDQVAHVYLSVYSNMSIHSNKEMWQCDKGCSSFHSSEMMKLFLKLRTQCWLTGEMKIHDTCSWVLVPSSHLFIEGEIPRFQNHDKSPYIYSSQKRVSWVQKAWGMYNFQRREARCGKAYYFWTKVIPVGTDSGMVC